MQQTDWDNILTGSNTEADSEMFTTKLHSLVKEFTRGVKGKNNKNNALSWLNTEIFHLVKERDSALKRSLKSKIVIGIGSPHYEIE